MRARAEAKRRRSHLVLSDRTEFAAVNSMRPVSQCNDDESLAIIDEEVARLPSRFRDAVVLCDLQGRSYVEAARHLRCPLGTLQSRLARGRTRLRARLVKRGLAPLALASILADSARAAVPERLAEATIRAATAGAAPASAAALAGAVAKSLVWSTFKSVAGAVVLTSFVLGAGALAHDRLLGDTPARSTQNPQPQRKGRALVLEVVNNADRAALAGAMVWAPSSSARSPDSQGFTNEEGRYTIALPAAAASYLRVVVVHPGFAPMELRWDGSQPIPENYTVALERGVPIGGTVRDKAGRPIAGARVLLQVGANPPRGGVERYPGPECAVAAALTDAQGRWRSDALPASAGPGVRLDLVTMHPDRVGLKQTVTAAALRAFATDGVLQSGRSLTGTVLSPTGRPVAGATITVQPISSPRFIERIRSGQDGRFRTGPFIDPSWREFTFVVQADGFASYAQVLLVSPEIPPQAIRMSPRRPLHGVVVDAQGHPIEGAAVRSATEFGYAGLDWEAETGVNGRFVWYDAPATGSYLLNIQKPPFRQFLARMVPGGSDEITVTLHHSQDRQQAGLQCESWRVASHSGF